MEKQNQFYIISCGGASNTGKYSDAVARMLMHNGDAKMLCLTRFSVDKPWAENAKKDIEKIIVLDGCPINCAEKTMLESGIDNYIHINTTDFGIVKGETPFSEEKAKEIVEHIKNLIIG